MVISHGQAERALATLLAELLRGPAPQAFVLNPGDKGLLASLDRLSAADASASPSGRSSIAAHVDHLRYGLSLLNRWSHGEDPFATAEFAASWRRQQVSDEEWAALRSALAAEARAWQQAIVESRDWTNAGLTEAMGSVVHLAYHLGAIRQIASATRGPRARD